MKRLLNLGVHHRHYGYQYAVCEHVPEIVRFIDAPFVVYKYFPFWRNSYSKRYSKLFFPVSKIDAYHVYNNIVLNNKPWFVTFESFFPRFLGNDYTNNAEWLKAYDFLVNKNCKSIIALTSAAKDLFFFEMKKRVGTILSEIESKTYIVRHGIEINTELNNNPSRENFNLLFVGHDFYRKGGRPLIYAFKKLLKKYDNVELTIVSSFNWNDYISCTTFEEHRKLFNEIQTIPQIKIFNSVARNDLLKNLMPNHNVLLLPTLDDSLGNTIFESLASGTPVIATDIFAIPEMIQHGINGFLINVPQDENKFIECFWQKDQILKRKRILAIEEIITEKLFKSLSFIIENPKKYFQMREKTIKIAAKQFSIHNRKEMLLRIYKSVL